MANELKSQPAFVRGSGVVRLPEGMTQEEADRRAREADQQRKENNS